MGEACEACRHFDEEGTELPTCLLHRRYMHRRWSCGDFEPGRDGSGGGDRDRDARG